MAADVKNIYGLSEGVFKACQFLGLKFPPKAVNNPQPVPSDYFGDDFEFDSAMIKKLCAERKWTKEIFIKRYENFKKIFYSHKCFLKHLETNLNIYFADYALFANSQNGASATDYFDFEFYNKSFALRETFRTQKHHIPTRTICNDPFAITVLNNKVKTNSLFAPFLHRDWIYPRDCTFVEFKNFIEKHPRFFSKPLDGSLGKGAEIINADSNKNIDELFDTLKRKNSLLEELVIQHEEIVAFCPDTVNTIRVYTILDIHNVVHILATSGRFGRVGGAVDNFHGGGYAVIIDPTTGIITTDGINEFHDRVQKHPDTGKFFKGFQYPCWEKMRVAVAKMAKMIPQLRHIGWDIAISNDNEIVLIEANGNAPDLGLQQAADSVGRLHLYQPLLDEIQNYKNEQMKFLGYRVNNLPDFDSIYDKTPARQNSRLKIAMSNLIPNCASLIDLGCRKSKLVKSITPPHLLKYYPVDFQKYDDEVIACNFNEGEFPDLKADTCLCALTAEYVEPLPYFLANMCNAAQKQILMLCRPVDKEIYPQYRWDFPFLTDFTEKFLIETIEKNHFKLYAQYPMTNKSVILYDFRRLLTAKENL